MPLSIVDNIKLWAGALLSPASPSSSAAPTMPDIRSTARKFSGILTNNPPPINTKYTSPWIDTNQSGANFVTVHYFSNQNFSAVGNQQGTIEGTDDPGLNVVVTLGGGVGTAFGANVINTISAPVTTRYWRFTITSGSTAASQFLISYVELNLSPNLQGFSQGSIAGSIPSLLLSNVAAIGADASLTGQMLDGTFPGVGRNLAVSSFVAVGAPGLSNTVWNALRTPAVFRGSQFSAAGQNVLWTAVPGKKARLMRYMIEVGEDATLSGGPLPVNLAFSEILGTATGATLAFPGFGFTHRLVVPAAVLATSFNGYQSGWIDLGNGQLLTTAALTSVAPPVAALAMGIMIPQVIGATNPAWTIASNQWEAAQIGFKTNGALGNFKLVQQSNAVASASSVALPALAMASGNSYFVFFRTTNPAGGAPTVTVTDTALNTYTTAALTTNATDSANGSSLGCAYKINAAGHAANILTVTCTVTVPTRIEAFVVEYSGLGSGGIDAALVGATGNSTTPASGNYTSVVAGDLLFSFFATAASLAAQPTVGSNFRLIGTLFNATQGALGVADNFGNGALTAGIVNVMCVGTEE